MAATTLQTRAIVHNIHKADSPVRIDWATCRSESQHTSDEIGPIQKYIFKTPPSKTVNHSKSNTKEAWSVINESIESTDRRVYSIPSLLERRGSLAGIGVFAKIKPEALAGQCLHPRHFCRHKSSAIKRTLISLLRKPFPVYWSPSSSSGGPSFSRVIRDFKSFTW